MSGVLAAMRLAGLVVLILLAAASSRDAAAQLQLTPQITPQSPVAAPSATPSRRDAERRRRDQKNTPAAPAEDAPANNGSFPRRLAQAEIKTRFFDGVPINARARGGATFTIAFLKDGKILRTDAKGETRSGRWKFLGDAYCSRWDGEKRDTCFTVVQDGEVVKVVLFTRAVATWSKTDIPPLP